MLTLTAIPPEVVAPVPTQLSWADFQAVGDRVRRDALAEVKAGFGNATDARTRALGYEIVDTVMRGPAPPIEVVLEQVRVAGRFTR